MSEHDHWTSQLELYLDGMLTGEALHAFKHRLNEDQQLQFSLKQQRRINLALRQRLAPSQQLATHEWFSKMELNGHTAADDIPKKLPLTEPAAQSTSPSGRLRFPLRRYSIAAALLLAVIGAWLAWTFVISGSGSSSELPIAKGPPRMAVDKYFQRKSADGFKPAWVCGDDEQFKASFREPFGQALLIAKLPENVSMFGLDYNTCLSAHTLSVLMKVNDQGVVVLVDKLERDKGAPSVGAPLKVFRRELGKLVLYEVTPLDRPGALDHFYDPDTAQPAQTETPQTN